MCLWGDSDTTAASLLVLRILCRALPQWLVGRTASAGRYSHHTPFIRMALVLPTKSGQLLSGSTPPAPPFLSNLHLAD